MKIQVDDDTMWDSDEPWVPRFFYRKSLAGRSFRLAEYAPRTLNAQPGMAYAPMSVQRVPRGQRTIVRVTHDHVVIMTPSGTPLSLGSPEDYEFYLGSPVVCTGLAHLAKVADPRGSTMLLDCIVGTDSIVVHDLLYGCLPWLGACSPWLTPLYPATVRLDLLHNLVAAGGFQGEIVRPAENAQAAPKGMDTDTFAQQALEAGDALLVKPLFEPYIGYNIPSMVHVEAELGTGGEPLC